MSRTSLETGNHDGKYIVLKWRYGRKLRWLINCSV